MPRKTQPRRRVKGEPWVWLSGGAVATGVVMIVGMLALIIVEGTVAFWPHDIDAFVMGEARYLLRHEQHGPVWISRDDKQLLLPGADLAWRQVDGASSAERAGSQRVTMADFRARQDLFDRYAGRQWRLRNAREQLVLDRQGREVSPQQFMADPEEYRPIKERGNSDFESRLFVVDSRRGELWMPEQADMLLVKVQWRDLSGHAVPFDFDPPRPATIADYREHPGLFSGANWLLDHGNGQVVQDEAGKPVTAARYLAEPANFPSPWRHFDEAGKRVPIEQLTGDDRWRDHKVLVGTPRGERAMDIRELPPNADGTPVKPYQLDETPTEILVRQGNQGETLYGDGAYFRWVRTELPDNEAMKHHRFSTYNEVVLERVALPHAILIERLEKGVLAGFVTRVTVDGEVLADVERDGREQVWDVFQREQSRMRSEYLKRYDLEKYDIGRVNFELKDLEDAVKQVRYDHRDSHIVAAWMEQLVDVYAQWQSQEPLPDPAVSPEDFQALSDQWLTALEPMLKDWIKAADALSPAPAELDALRDARELTLKRATVQAQDFSKLRHEVVRLRHLEELATYDFMTSDGRVATLPLAKVVRAFRPNELGLFGKLGVYASRVWEYLSDDPRESNTEGGIWPVILGTLVMTLLMCVVVVPFGVISALYLREYAKQGTLVSAVRISVNNLAGVPSIVFGIFGLGFFCVMVGGSIDDLLFPELQPAPMFGGGGVMWAALTLALLTVPVVIVSTEESLSAVPSSQREASLACGASKFQTIWRVILPQAMPGVLTGTILAMARGAGEVAPLMLVGAVKYAPYPPADSIPPFVHLERKFMHLGFHVYDVGFQSPNVDNTKPLVFATSLVLIALVAALNIFAISLRNKLRKKLATSHV